MVGGLGLLGDLPVLFAQFFTFEDVLFQLERLGLFQFILPFFLLFAVVFGVLDWTKIFGGNRGLHAVIAIVVGLLGIRYPVYADFLQVISPKLGVGLVIILILIILTGLFIPEGSQHILGWIMIGIGVVIALVIFAQSYEILGGGYLGGFTNSDLIGWVIIIGLLIGFIVAVVTAGAGGSNKGSKGLARWFEKVTGGS